MAGADRTSIIPKTNRNRPGLKLVGGKPEYITIHETANTAAGANAEMHRKFVRNGGGEEGVSFHYVVDDKESIQLVPDDEVAWHAGDGPTGRGNNRSIAIEICVNSDGNFLLAVQNLTRLVLKLMAEFDIPANKVVQHNHWSGKNCPLNLRANSQSSWQELLATLTPLERTFPQTGKTVRGSFLRKWEGEPRAEEYWGFPIREEETMEFPNMGTIQIQYFQRVRFEKHPDGVIRLGLLGVEATNNS